MGRKEPLIDPRIGSGRVGLIVTDAQVIDLSLAAIFGQMLADNDTNIIALASCDKSGIPGHPFTPAQRIAAIRGLYGAAFRIVELQDLGPPVRPRDHGDYVLDRVAKSQLPAPTDVYVRTTAEALCYQNRIGSLSGKIGRRGVFTVWMSAHGKRIHIMDRGIDPMPGQAEARALIEQRHPSWKEMVPAKLWKFYDWEYPGHLRVAIEASRDVPVSADEVPPGTRFMDLEGTITVKEE